MNLIDITTTTLATTGTDSQMPTVSLDSNIGNSFVVSYYVHPTPAYEMGYIIMLCHTMVILVLVHLSFFTVVTVITVVTVA